MRGTLAVMTVEPLKAIRVNPPDGTDLTSSSLDPPGSMRVRVELNRTVTATEKSVFKDLSEAALPFAQFSRIYGTTLEFGRAEVRKDVQADTVEISEALAKTGEMACETSPRPSRSRSQVRATTRRIT